MSNPHHMTSITQNAVANATISVKGDENTFDNVDNFASAENMIASDTGGKHGSGAATWTDNGEGGAAAWQNADAEATIVVVGDKNQFHDVSNLANADNEAVFVFDKGDNGWQDLLAQNAFADASIIVAGDKNKFHDVTNIASGNNHVAFLGDTGAEQRHELTQDAIAHANIVVEGDKNHFNDVTNIASATNDASIGHGNSHSQPHESTPIDLEQFADANAVIYVIGDKNQFHDVINHASASNDADLSF